MPIWSIPSGDLVLQLMPSHNPDRADRARAWDQWLGAGGAEPVRRFIRWSNGTSAEDDEILQDALITAYVKVEAGEYQLQGVPFTAFVKKIAWYKILEASRHYRPYVALEDVEETVEDDATEPTERVEFWREHEALHEAMAQLPPRRSHVIWLYENGFSTAEIAERLRIREDLVRKEKSLGLRQLRDEMTLAIAT